MSPQMATPGLLAYRYAVDEEANISRSVCEHGSLARSCLVCELEADLAAARRAIASTRFSLTEQARRDVHMYLVCEMEDDAAAAEWELAAMRRGVLKELGNQGTTDE